MITPNELFEKSSKLFNKVVMAELKGETIFPLIIPSNKKLSGTSFSDLKATIVPLYQQSKQAKGKGYTIDWKEKSVEGTKQKIPDKIYFETFDDFLSYTKRTKDYETIQRLLQLLRDNLPELYEWGKANISFLLNHAPVFNDLIKVCVYFRQNEPPHELFLRELPIEVHSKFIEENSASIRKLLDVLLPAHWISSNEIDFLSRYGIKKPAIYTQIRILDDTLKSIVGFNEVGLTLEDSGQLSWQPEKVFIVENKACFLSFPKIKNAVAIFGEGFKSRLSKHISWLNNTELYCWFDLDAAGFEMLNSVRHYYPQAKSFLMNEKTYKTFERFSVASPYRKLPLGLLTDDELQLYSFLQSNNKRLEQERISNQYVNENLPV
ncbi:MAG: DUF2220 family protein [Ferruginibacter sp.]